jgi:hypothetical protein
MRETAPPWRGGVDAAAAVTHIDAAREREARGIGLSLPVRGGLVSSRVVTPGQNMSLKWDHK